MPGSLVPHRGHEDANDRKRAAVEGRGRALVEAPVKCLSEDGGWKRQERDEHQVHGIKQEELLVDPTDPIEHGMMINPNSADHHEANCIGQIRRPQLQQSISQIGSRRNLNFKDEQSNGDGENAVAKCFEAIGLHAWLS